MLVKIIRVKQEFDTEVREPTPVWHHHLGIRQRNLDVIGKTGALRFRQLGTDIRDRTVVTGHDAMFGAHRMYVAVVYIGDVDGC